MVDAALLALVDAPMSRDRAVDHRAIDGDEVADLFWYPASCSIYARTCGLKGYVR
jgi:hypothetical protein